MHMLIFSTLLISPHGCSVRQQLTQVSSQQQDRKRKLEEEAFTGTVDEEDAEGDEQPGKEPQSKFSRFCRL
jgi:hypothetical protein